MLMSTVNEVQCSWLLEGQVWKLRRKQLKYVRHYAVKRINFGLSLKADHTHPSLVDNYTEKVKAM